jgi:hypothetical protein
MKRYIICLILSSALFLSFNGCKKDDSSVNNVVTNNAPTIPANPFPADNSTGIDDSTAVNLSWESTDPDLNDTLKFDIFVGTSLPLSDIPLAANLTSPTYNMGVLTFPGTTFYWQIKAKDRFGASSSGNVWRFTIRTRP